MNSNNIIIIIKKNHLSSSLFIKQKKVVMHANQTKHPDPLPRDTTFKFTQTKPASLHYSYDRVNS